MEISTNITSPTTRRNFLKFAGGVAGAGALTHSTGITALAQERRQQRPGSTIVEASRIEAAILDLREKKHSCSQATFLGICRALGGSLAEEQLLALSAGFAGGIGKTFNDGSCGALVGGVMVVGLYQPGQTDKAVTDGKRLFEQFKEREGTVICKDILQKYGGFSNCTNCCVHVGRDVAAILSQQ